jgi:hypothetical protein
MASSHRLNREELNMPETDADEANFDQPSLIEHSTMLYYQCQRYKTNAAAGAKRLGQQSTVRQNTIVQ